MSYMIDLDEYREEVLVGEIILRAKYRREGKCDYCCRERTTKPCKMRDRHNPTNEWNERLAHVHRMLAQGLGLVQGSPDPHAPADPESPTLPWWRRVSGMRR